MWETMLLLLIILGLSIGHIYNGCHIDKLNNKIHELKNENDKLFIEKEKYKLKHEKSKRYINQQFGKLKL